MERVWLKTGKDLEEILSSIFDILKNQKTNLKIDNIKNYLKKEPLHTETIKIEIRNKNNFIKNIYIKRIPEVGTRFTTNVKSLYPIDGELNCEIERSNIVSFDQTVNTVNGISYDLLLPLKTITKDKTLPEPLNSMINNDYIPEKSFYSSNSKFIINGIYGTKDIFALNTFTLDDYMTVCSGPSYLISGIGVLDTTNNIFGNRAKNNKIFETLGSELNIDTNNISNENLIEKIYNELTQKIFSKNMDF